MLDPEMAEPCETVTQERCRQEKPGVSLDRSERVTHDGTGGANVVKHTVGSVEVLREVVRIKLGKTLKGVVSHVEAPWGYSLCALTVSPLSRGKAVRDLENRVIFNSKNVPCSFNAKGNVAGGKGPKGPVQSLFLSATESLAAR